MSGIAAASKVYDGGTSAVVNTANAVFAGLVEDDEITVTSNGAFADKNAGLAKTVLLSSSYDGANAGNYAIAEQATTTADLILAACARTHGLTVLHYEKDFDLIAAATGQPTEWLAAAGALP